MSLLERRRLHGSDLPPLGDEVNVSARLRARAKEAPQRCAVRSYDGRELSYAELEDRVNSIARGIKRLGAKRGDRACLFVPPSPDLIAITHALFRLGVVPVLIDPGMGRKSLLDCVERVRPRLLIGIPKVHAARLLFPRAFRSVEFFVTVGPRLGWKGQTLEKLARESEPDFPIADTLGSEEAAILFTSGSTGPPKGVAYTHAMFESQLFALENLYGLTPGDVDVACFPLFALFDNALGLTTVFPDIDPSHPGQCNPEKIVHAIEANGATFTFASPSVWRRVVPWMKEHNRRFTTLRRVTSAGAPIPPALVQELYQLLPAGSEVHTPYGATEALPVANLANSDLTDDVRRRVENGEGTCVGRAAPGIDVRLIRITDEALGTWPSGAWNDDWEVEPGEIGEICVRGPVVTHEYKFAPEATRLAKIRDMGRVWHRLGDVGRIDDDGRLWFLGRKSHRIETAHGLLLPVPTENVFNTCPGVLRSALVGAGTRGAEEPHLVIELEPGVLRSDVERNLRAHIETHSDLPKLAGIHFHSGFPVDVRHNAKINRPELKHWVEAKSK